MKFLKLTGRFYRKENGNEVLYAPGSTIEASEEELRKHDPELKTWKLTEKSQDNKEQTIESATKLTRKKLQIRETSDKKLQIRETSDKKLQTRETSDKKFDVVNENSGKVLNDIPLSKEEAHDIVTDKDDTEE